MKSPILPIVIIIVIAISIVGFFRFNKIYIANVDQCTTDSCCTQKNGEASFIHPESGKCEILREEFKKIVRGNPATESCIKSGAVVDVREDEEGKEYGVCMFLDGHECEQWDFYEGRCE